MVIRYPYLMLQVPRSPFSLRVYVAALLVVDVGGQVGPETLGGHDDVLVNLYQKEHPAYLQIIKDYFFCGFSKQ